MVGIPHTRFSKGWTESYRSLKKGQVHDSQFFDTCNGYVDLIIVTFECSVSEFLYAHFICYKVRNLFDLGHMLNMWLTGVNMCICR